ncbi:MAG: type II toxin-antitoxin system Phd/YefM family antitoxin [Alphaproteobacteria bacterium]|nr:type II toxin-antitoxin system Phd/YefM family antitoxin [Alphaproteobacteria bacterium]
MNVQHRGAAEARRGFPALLAAAKKGRSTIITWHGQPVAALLPISSQGLAAPQQPLLPMAGSGKDLWGKSSTRTLRKLRNELSR